MNPETNADESRPALLPERAGSPWLLFGAWVLPQIALLLLNLGAWAFLRGSMSVAQKTAALWLAGGELVLLLAGAGVFVGFLLARQPVRLSVCLCGVLLHTAWLWNFLSQMEGLWPADVQGWMFEPSQLCFYQFALMAPALFYCVLRLAALSLPLPRWGDLLASAGVMVGVPVAWFAGGTVIGRLFADCNWPGFVVWLVVVVAVASTVLVLLAFLRFLCLVYTRMAGHRWAEFALPALAGLVLPLAGLLLNKSIPFPCDFQSTGVYVLTVVNGLVLLLPTGPRFLLPRWLLRAALWPFTVYFFIVFLPFLPLALPAILAIGAGFLILAPVVLFGWHTRQLCDEGRAVAQRFGGARAALLFLAAILLIPAGMAARAAADRHALMAALNHVCNPDPLRPAARFSPSAAGRALQRLREMKDGIELPFIAEAYNAYVFDGMTLPDDTMQTLHRALLGTAAPAPQKNHGFSLFLTSRSVASGGWTRGTRAAPRDVALESVVAMADTSNGMTHATLALGLKNHGAAPAEFVTKISVPPGVLVTGYWLDTNGRHKPGRIVEKKTALWVYHMIRDVSRRDPGLLLWKSGGELKLSVFPLAKDERRKTGIEFSFPAGLNPRVDVDGRDVDLSAEKEETLPLAWSDADGRTHMALTPDALRALPAGRRAPRLQVVVDHSLTAAVNPPLAAEWMVRCLKDAPGDWQACRVTYANFEQRDAAGGWMPPDCLPETLRLGARRALPARGGFCPDRVVAHTLLEEARRRPKADEAPAVPVCVVLSAGPASNMVNTLALDAYGDLAPDMPCYFRFDGRALTRVSFAGGDTRTVARLAAPEPVTVFRGGGRLAACSTNGGCVSLPAPPAAWEVYDFARHAWRLLGAVRMLPAGDYTAGMELWENARAAARQPARLLTDLSRLTAESRRLGVLIPETAYIVVENAAQEATLKQKEKLSLGANRALSFDEHPVVKAPAPPLVWLLPVAVALILLRPRTMNGKCRIPNAK